MIIIQDNIQSFKRAYAIPLILIMLLLVGCISLQPADIAKIRLPAIYASNMVLQRDRRNAIHGYASPHTQLKIQIAGHVVRSDADSDGKWFAELPAFPAGGPYKIDIDGLGHVTLNNVLFGDVWLCAGQSNMARELSFDIRGARAIKEARDPFLRVFTIPEAKSNVAKFHGAGYWLDTTPQNAVNFSACAYYFAQEMRAKTSVPIGIVTCCARGLPLNVWLRPEISDNEKAPPLFVTSSVFNAMVAPIIGYGVKGIIWYQGESDIFRAPHYQKTLPKMIDDLRKQWNEPDAPVLLVQLPNYAEHDVKPFDSLWAEFRECQMEATKAMRNAHLIVTVDTASVPKVGLHPRDKSVIAHRLADAALALGAPQDKDFTLSPHYQSINKSSDSISVKFETHGKPLVLKNKLNSGFSIAGADKKFAWAQAEVLPGGTEIKVWNAAVSSPLAVRYAWADNPVAGLYTAAGDPAVPFRTDAYKGQPGDYQMGERFNFLKEMNDGPYP